jgi:hypothetical protein
VLDYCARVDDGKLLYFSLGADYNSGHDNHAGFEARARRDYCGWMDYCRERKSKFSRPPTHLLTPPIVA